MAYTDTIERLAKIVDHLAPLGQMTKGAPLRSDDWNVLVSAVNDLAQIAIVREKGGEASQEGQFAAALHEHIGQVDQSWFVPATQALFDSGGSAPETAAELKRLGDGMTDLRQMVTTVQAQMKALQTRMDALDDGGRDRDGRLGRLELRVEAVHDLRPEVTRLDGRIAAFGDRVTEALKLRDQLVDFNGNPIELPDIVKRLQGVEDLRENLMGPDGVPARYRDFDARLLQLEKGAITPENLGGMLFDRLKSGGILENLSSGLLEIVKTDSASRFQEVGSKLEGFASSLSDLSLQVGKNGETLDGLSGRVSVTETQLGRVGSLEMKFGDLSVRANALEVVVQDQAFTLQGLKAVPGELERLDVQMSLMIEPLQQRVFTLEENFKLFDTKRLSFDTFDSRLKTVEDFSAQIAITTERVSTLETSLSLIKTDFTNLQLSTNTFENSLSSLESLSSQLATTTQRVGTLETQFSASVSTFENRLSSVEGLSSQLATTTQRVGTLETQLKMATGDTSRLQASVNNFDTRLSTVEALSPQLATTNQRVGTLESQLSVATADFSKLQASVSNVSTQLKTVQGLSDQLAFTTQRIGTLETKVTATTANFTTLESRLKKIELTRPFTAPIGIPR